MTTASRRSAVAATGGGAVIGSRVLRREDRRLLTGRGCFVDDMPLAGVAHAAFLRSEHAHATLASVQVSAARSMRGVLDVVTAAEVPPEIRIPMRMYARPGMERFLQPPLARERVRYSGEPVAVVIAESRYVAEDAVEAIRVEYEPRSATIDAELALAADAPVLFEGAGSNLAAEFEIADGSVDDAFAAAELVIDQRLRCQRHGAVPLEPRGLVAAHEPDRDRLTVWGAAKVVHANRRILAGLLDLPEERVRFVELDVGGGFGARGEFYPEDYLIPLCAIRLGRPVRWTEDREEHLRTSNHSREQLHEIAIALGSDGEFLGLRDRVTFNTGAYVRTHGAVVPNMTAALLPGPYRWGAYRCRIRQVVTNKTPAGTYRAPGRYEANFARERLIDVAAHRLDLDPIALRRRNLVTSAAMPFARGTHTDGHPVTFDSGDFPLLLDKGTRFFRRKEMSRWREAVSDGARRRGLGYAFFVEKSGIGGWDYARAELTAEGKIALYVGSASIGQGVETVLAQIAADALGVPYESVVDVVHGDTDRVPEGMGSFGSRATMIAGSSVSKAGVGLRKRILAEAAELLEVAPDDLVLDGDAVVVRGSSAAAAVSLPDVARAAARGGEDGRRLLSEEARFTSEAMSFPYGLHCVGVEIDLETGAVAIERYAVAYDVGRAINPTLVEGQIAGGAAQGVGGALFEEFAYTPEGQLAAGSFIDYLLPTALEAPALDILVTEDAPTPLTPIGAKGAGEGGTAAAGAAIANAVSDALDAEATELPLTPERVLSLAGRGGSST